jgi:hypothetical protein
MQTEDGKLFDDHRLLAIDGLQPRDVPQLLSEVAPDHPPVAALTLKVSGLAAVGHPQTEKDRCRRREGEAQRDPRHHLDQRLVSQLRDLHRRVRTGDSTLSGELGELAERTDDRDPPRDDGSCVIARYRSQRDTDGVVPT